MNMKILKGHQSQTDIHHTKSLLVWMILVTGFVCGLSPVHLIASPEGEVQATPDIADAVAEMGVKGPEEAPVVLTIFSDFQSPLSAQAAIMLKELLSRYPEKIRLVFKHFPLPFHQQAELAHEAALAAGEQGKFWEMHDLLFQNQQNLRPEQLLKYAKSLGLDLATFRQALEEHRYRGSVRQGVRDGKNQDVRGVPTLFINDRRLDGVQTLFVVQALIDKELAHQPQKEVRDEAPETVGEAKKHTVVHDGNDSISSESRHNSQLTDLDHFSPLRDLFQSDRGQVRLIALLSPN
jgi:protein-disulfide isomerase